MLTRWNPIVNSINQAFFILKRLVHSIKPVKRGRGRNPKRKILGYAMLIAVKEFDKRTLRGAEVHLSKLIFDERIDHSVISYWENKVWMKNLMGKFI